MFKQDNFSNSIMESMEKSLLANQEESIHGFNKIAKAVDFLHKAAEILDDADMLEASDDLSKVLESLTK